MVENIMADDKGKFKIDNKIKDTIEFLRSSGEQKAADKLEESSCSHPKKNRSFHYLPYRTDSKFEQTFLKEVLTFDLMEEKNLEVYYNGDRSMTEFKIKCYKKRGKQQSYIGLYTPDFLIIKRKDKKIYKVVVVETKGDIYANDPFFLEKRKFMEKEFSMINNKEFGYKRFDYLYLEDTLSENERLKKTKDKIEEFFTED